MHSHFGSVSDMAPSLCLSVRGTSSQSLSPPGGLCYTRPVLSVTDLFTTPQNILYSMIQDIASLWSDPEDRRRYKAAASNFRIPYWDWAANPPAGESVLPRSIGGSALIDVDGPNGQQRIANPLFSYEFKPLHGPDFLDTAPVSDSMAFIIALSF